MEIRFFLPELYLPSQIAAVPQFGNRLNSATAGGPENRMRPIGGADKLEAKFGTVYTPSDLLYWAHILQTVSCDKTAVSEAENAIRMRQELQVYNALREVLLTRRGLLDATR